MNLLPKAEEPRDPPTPPTFSSQIVVEPSPSTHHPRRKLRNATKDDSLDIIPPTQRTPLVFSSSILLGCILSTFHLSWPNFIREKDLFSFWPPQYKELQALLSQVFFQTLTIFIAIFSNFGSRFLSLDLNVAGCSIQDASSSNYGGFFQSSNPLYLRTLILHRTMEQKGGELHLLCFWVYQQVLIFMWCCGFLP